MPAMLDGIVDTRQWTFSCIRAMQSADPEFALAVIRTSRSCAAAATTEWARVRSLRKRLRVSD